MGMPEVTLKDVINHLHAMEERLSRRFDVIDNRLDAQKIQMTQTEAKLSWQIDALDK